MSVTSDAIDAESLLSMGEAIFDEEEEEMKRELDRDHHDGLISAEPMNSSFISDTLFDLNNTGHSNNSRKHHRSSSRQKSFNSSIVTNNNNNFRATTPSINSLPSRFSVESPVISFSKGERKFTYLAEKADTPGPIYEAVPKSISSSFSFPKGKRFVEEELKILQQSQKPPPTAYNPKDHIKYRTDPSFSFGSRTPAQEYRTDSPGPIYNPSEVASKHFSKSSTTFGAGDRSLKLNEGTSNFPPPGAYSPSFLDSKRNISFSISKKEENYIYFGDQLSANRQSVRVPGPVYDPSYRLSMTSSPSFSFGSRTPLPGDQIPMDHPGLTDYNKQFVSRSCSIQGKDREADPHITYNAPRARFLGDSFLSENLGRASPGPKYNVTQSFVIPSKRQGEEDHILTFKAKEKKKKESKKPPSQIYPGFSISKTSTQAAESPGYLYTPKTDFSSRVPRVCSPVLKAAKPVDNRKPATVYPQLRNPTISSLSNIPSSTVPKFSRTGNNVGVRTPPPISTSPGPIYNVDWETLEKNLKRGTVKGGKFGGLS